MIEADGRAIVGRAVPLGRLASALQSSARGVRSVVFVSGTAGMGKTSLIRSAVDTAIDEGAIVGWGTCWQGDSAPGFWPWMQAFDGLSRGVGAAAAIDAAGRERAALSVLVRDLGAGVNSTSDPDRHRLLLFDAARRWLEALTVSQPIVVVLDDLQWSDPSTLDLLDYVIAAPVRSRLLVVGAFRHDELDHDAQARLGALASHGDHIHLGGLTPGDVEELVSGICGADVARTLAPDLHRRTGGHPLFVSELARLSEAGDWGQLPTAVTGAVSLRLDMLPPDTRRILDAASVLGNRLLPDVLGVVAGKAAAEIVERLAPAADSGLVQITDADEMWFSHDLFRETVDSMLSVSTRRELHAGIGNALVARRARGVPVAPGDLARHFVQAISLVDPQHAIRWAREAAADERGRSAFGEAAAQVRRVREAAADAGIRIEPDLLVALLIDEADHQARSGDPDAARGLLADAARVAPTPESGADVALSVQRLGAKFAAPRDEIIDQLEEALDAVRGTDVIREARLTAALARELQHSVAEDRRRVASLSKRALALGRRSEDDETLIACLLARHDAMWEPGTGAERAALGHEIALVGGRLASTDRLAEGLLLEANGLLESGSAAFRPVLDRWFGLLEARGEPRDRYMVLTRRAALALLDGNADEAELLMNEAAQTGVLIHEPDTGNVLMSQRVELARTRGEPDELRRLARDAVNHWTGAPVLAHAVAAGALATAGDLDAGGREVAMVTESGGLAKEGSYLRSVLVTHLADAAVALGDAELCRSLFDDIDALTDSCGVNGAVVAFAGPFAHPAGVLAVALGDIDRGRQLLERSVDMSRRLGASVWIRRGETALSELDQGPRPTRENHDTDRASMTRSGGIWTVSWGDESASLPHSKGLSDIATLVFHRGEEMPALRLVSDSTAPGSSRDQLIDRSALNAYRIRLVDLDAEIDCAGTDADIGRIEQLEHEREQLLAEIRRATGLAGRLRRDANDPAERARKAVSARIRDAIGRLNAISPRLAAHLDRSIRTGSRCSYMPSADEDIQWDVEIG